MDKIKIGKDVIESLTLGMYEDSKFIFREYIQNSADQIDKAVSEGLLKDRSEGSIFININKEERIITFEDNATGIQSNKVLAILGNIAQSTKDRARDKGFRGIGRLGGLGYCDELVFETSYFNEPIKSTMKWDAKSLKQIINNRSRKEEASDVINAITELDNKNEKKEAHYFKVILKNVNNNALLNVKQIREYLSMVAPVPFESHFVFKSKIYNLLEENNLHIDEYKIFINTEQLYKAYTTTIYNRNGQKKDEIFDIAFKKILLDEEIIGFIWYGVSKSIEQISSNNIARGFRLRKGNIQIGTEDSLRRLFDKDSRFHFYFFGEIHAFSPELIPNARRDYFLENDTCSFFENEIKKFFSNEVHKIPYTASDIKSAVRKMTEYNELKGEIQKKEKTYFSSPDEKNKLKKELEVSKEKAIKAEKELDKINNKISNDKVLNGIYKKLVNENKNYNQNLESGNDKEEMENNSSKKIFYRTDKTLTNLNKHDRKIISRVFNVIDDKLTPELADNLKFWIEEEFK